jgi:hypothetical protein
MNNKKNLNNPLFKAMVECTEFKLKNLNWDDLIDNSDCFETDLDKNSPLMYALSNRIDIPKKSLIKLINKSDLSAVNEHNESAIFQALKNSKLDKEIIENILLKSDLTIKNNFFYTPLTTALLYNIKLSHKMWEVLFEKTDLHMKTQENNNALMLLVAYSASVPADFIEKLFNTVDLSEVNKFGDNLPIYALKFKFDFTPVQWDKIYEVYKSSHEEQKKRVAFYLVLNKAFDIFSIEQNLEILNHLSDSLTDEIKKTAKDYKEKVINVLNIFNVIDLKEDSIKDKLLKNKI